METQEGTIELMNSVSESNHLGDNYRKERRFSSTKKRTHLYLNYKPSCATIIDSLSILVLGVEHTTMHPPQSSHALEFIYLKTFKSLKQVRLSKLRYSKLLFRQGSDMLFLLITSEGLQEQSFLKGSIRRINHDFAADKASDVNDICLITPDIVCISGDFRGLRLINLSHNQLDPLRRNFITEIEQNEKFYEISYDKTHNCLLATSNKLSQLKIFKYKDQRLDETASVKLDFIDTINYLGLTDGCNNIYFYTSSSLLESEVKPLSNAKEYVLKNQYLLNAFYVPALKCIISVGRVIDQKGSFCFSVELFNVSKLDQAASKEILNDGKERTFLASKTQKIMVGLILHSCNLDIIGFVHV